MALVDFTISPEDPKSIIPWTISAIIVAIFFAGLGFVGCWVYYAHTYKISAENALLEVSSEKAANAQLITQLDQANREIETLKAQNAVLATPKSIKIEGMNMLQHWCPWGGASVCFSETLFAGGANGNTYTFVNDAYPKSPFTLSNTNRSYEFTYNGHNYELSINILDNTKLITEVVVKRAD